MIKEKRSVIIFYMENEMGALLFEIVSLKLVKNSIDL